MKGLFMYLSSIDNINFPTIFTFSLIPNYSFGYKDKTYSPVMMFVPVLVDLVYNVYINIYVRIG